MKRTILLAAAAGLALAATPAFASHGKVGLWATTTSMAMDMPNMNMHVPPRTHSATFCMTAQQVASDAPPPQSENHDCQMTNMHHSGNTITADMVCHGRMNGTGHFAITYDSDTHYTAHFAMAMNGMTMNSTTDAKWLKPDCAGAH